MANQGIGFDLFRQVGGTLINCVSTFNGGYGIYCGTGQAQDGNSTFGCSTVANPIALINTAAFNIVQDNIIVCNGVAGIMDMSTANNSYINNYALNNVINFTGAIFNQTPVRNWPLPAAPASVNNNGLSADKLDNLDIA